MQGESQRASCCQLLCLAWVILWCSLSFALPARQMLAMQDQWGAAFRAAGDIGRLRHQPGPVGIAMLSTGFAFIWLLLLNLNYTDGASVDSFAIMLPGFFMALLILGVDEVARWAQHPQLQ